VTSVLDEIAEHLGPRHGSPVLKVAIDGVDGVGKTTFADKLAEALRSRGRDVIRASVDGFHNPRAVRYRLGRTPEGFYRDSYDYPALRRVLLEPLSPGGSLRYRTAVFDHITDSPVEAPEQTAREDAMFVLDGLFLHRPELRDLWDFSIFLDAPFEITVPRGAARGAGFGDPDPLAASNHRYVEGNRLYFREADPTAHASVVIDYADFARPKIASRR
jgi:uridine kinase